jgi:hypothetical protein
MNDPQKRNPKFKYPNSKSKLLHEAQCINIIKHEHNVIWSVIDKVDKNCINLK